MIARVLFCFLFCLLFSFAMPAMAQLPKLEVAVKRVDMGEQHVFDVTASGAVNASPAAVWKILTDYDRMAEFVPDLKTTKVLSRSGNKVVVEQYGVARFLFFKRSIHLVVNVLEEPMTSIEITLVNGDMKVYACRWELVPVPETGGTRILYSGKLVPKFYVPGMLGANIIRSDIERMMKAVLERLDRPADQAG
jgi:ribosome-associated toxin RatA of RatAB toxin-antitoxin module